MKSQSHTKFITHPSLKKVNFKRDKSRTAYGNHSRTVYVAMSGGVDSSVAPHQSKARCGTALYFVPIHD